MHRTLFTLSIVGLAVAGYLWVTNISPIPLVCSEGGGCHEVQASRFAKHFGLPTAFYGVMFYAALAVAALMYSTTQPQPLLKTFLYTSTGIGLLISAYLTYLEAFVIYAWCAWCVTSAIIATLAFVIVWLHPKKDGTEY